MLNESVNSSSTMLNSHISLFFCLIEQNYENRKNNRLSCFNSHIGTHSIWQMYTFSPIDCCHFQWKLILKVLSESCVRKLLHMWWVLILFRLCMCAVPSHWNIILISNGLWHSQATHCKWCRFVDIYTNGNSCGMQKKQHTISSNMGYTSGFWNYTHFIDAENRNGCKWKVFPWILRCHMVKGKIYFNQHKFAVSLSTDPCASVRHAWRYQLPIFPALQPEQLHRSSLGIPKSFRYFFPLRSLVHT